MAFDPFTNQDMTEKERCIVETARRYPNISKGAIAEECNTSKGYVTETLRRYGDPGDFSGLL